jgi:hypothetical protein
MRCSDRCECWCAPPRNLQAPLRGYITSYSSGAGQFRRQRQRIRRRDIRSRRRWSAIAGRNRTPAIPLPSRTDFGAVIANPRASPVLRCQHRRSRSVSSTWGWMRSSRPGTGPPSRGRTALAKPQPSRKRAAANRTAARQVESSCTPSRHDVVGLRVNPRNEANEVSRRAAQDQSSRHNAAIEPPSSALQAAASRSRAQSWTSPAAFETPGLARRPGDGQGEHHDPPTVSGVG